jgi:hypothetical protein
VLCSGVCGGGFWAGEEGCGGVSRGIPESPWSGGALLPLPVIPGVSGLASAFGLVFVFSFLLFLVFFCLCVGCLAGGFVCGAGA